MIAQDIFELLGKFSLYVISVASGAYLFIKFLGESWVKNLFAKDFEHYKAQTSHEFDMLLNRKIKWHDYELEILSQTWKKLIDSYWALYALTKQDYILDLSWDSMTDEEFLTSLNKTHLTDKEKEHLSDKKKGDRMHTYYRIQYLDLQQQSTDAILEFRRYFNHNKIFIKPQIKKAFELVLNHFGSIALVEQRDFYSNNKPISSSQTFERTLNLIQPFINEIEKNIQDELYPQTIEEKP
jgi:hypothetical protein